MSFKSEINSLPIFSTKIGFNPFENAETILKILEKDFFFYQGILESIQEEYFSEDQNFNTTRFELNNISTLSKPENIISRCQILIHQHHVVSKKVLFLVLQHQSKYKDEFIKILKLKKDLISVISTCKICRFDLNIATHQSTSSSLKILYYWKKRKILEQLLSILYSFKTLVSFINLNTIFSCFTALHMRVGNRLYCLITLVSFIN